MANAVLRPAGAIRDHLRAMESEVLARIVELTRNLIVIPSTEARPEERRQCARQIHNHLDTLPHVEIREYECHGVQSLVAAPPEHPHPEILLLAHLDVIEHPDDSVYVGRIEDGRIVGPGAGDMKGALAILLEVFRDVHLRAPHASLGLAVTSDEETGGMHGVRYLFDDVGLRCGVALIPDGGSLNRVTVEEKGLLHVHLAARGETAHAARPWLGVNAVERLMDRLTAVRARFEDWRREEDTWFPTVAVTRIGTDNRTTNRIPAQAEATLDIRYPPPFAVGGLMDELRSILGDGIDAEIVISSEPTELAPDPRYREITEQRTGQAVASIRDDGSSDARFIRAYGIPVLMSRPLVGNLHAPDEWIDIASMGVFYRIYLDYLERRLGLAPSA